jgi:hypothetical protein
LSKNDPQPLGWLRVNKSPKNILIMNSIVKDPESDKISYKIHDNGSRPFTVIIDQNDITIFRNNKYKYKDNEDGADKTEADEDGYFLRKKLKYEKPKQIFIGKSPSNEMTQFSGEYGPEYDGNAILIRPSDDLVYIFVGISIERFTADSEIIHFVSPVGNNDVPYTYAISAHKIYLLSENAVINVSDIGEKLLKKFIKGSEDPYTYYYRHVKHPDYIATEKFKKLDTETLIKRDS